MTLELLTTQQMDQADAITIEAGIPGVVLMEKAGHGVASAVMERFTPQPVLVLCGPGNNGGDGFVVARILHTAGWPVTLALLGDADQLKGDAAHMFERWAGSVEPLALALRPGTAFALKAANALVVDALFGAGLNRKIQGEAADLIEQLNRSAVRVVSIDVPSGLDGNTGQATGPVFNAELTVTFFRKKPAHVLMPGRNHCGVVKVLDIGIASSVAETLAPQLWENDPALWLAHFPQLGESAHKYKRGHAVIVSGPLANGGAARLAARGALRMGAGLVTVACPPDAVLAHASQLNAVMTTGFDDLDVVLADRRMNAAVLGPGNGVGETTRSNVVKALAHGMACVVDADALTSFQDEPSTLFDCLNERCVLTPHDGEFARLFPATDQPSRLARAQAAARSTGAVVVSKGPDTVIAAPDGRAVINTNAPPTLATAGSGDVLSGFIGGLLAQRVPAFEAACIAVWLHGRSAVLFGPGLIAEDLSEMLPKALAELAELS